jgi:hypothetical protein
LQVERGFLSDTVANAREAVESLVQVTQVTWPVFSYEVESQALRKVARKFLKRLEGIRCDSVQHTFQNILHETLSMPISPEGEAHIAAFLAVQQRAAVAPPGEAAKKRPAAAAAGALAAPFDDGVITLPTSGPPAKKRRWAAAVVSDSELLLRCWSVELLLADSDGVLLAGTHVIINP